MPVLGLQKQQLHHDEIGVSIVNRTIKKDDPVFEQQITDSELSGPLVVAIGLRVERLRLAAVQ